MLVVPSPPLAVYTAIVLPCSASGRPRRVSRSRAAENSCGFGGNTRNSWTPARIAWRMTPESACGAVPITIADTGAQDLALERRQLHGAHLLQRQDDQIERLVAKQP